MSASAIGNITYPSMYDLSQMEQRRSPEIANIMRVLNEEAPILDDISWIEANHGTYMETYMDASLPEAGTRNINQGMSTSKSSTQHVVDRAAQYYSAYSIDRDLANLNGNKAAFFANEDAKHLEAIRQKLTRDLFYGNFGAPSDAGGMLGLGPRYHTLNPDHTPLARQVLSAVNPDSPPTQDPTYSSIWMVSWGPDQITGFYPNGLDYGFQRTVLGGSQGDHELIDADKRPGSKFLGWAVYNQWNAGLCVRDYRWAVRIANIPGDIFDQVLENGIGTGVNSVARRITRLLSAAAPMLPELNGRRGRTSIYMNRKVYQALSIAVSESSNLLLSWQEIYNRPKVMTWMGTPIRIIDALDFNEPLVTKDPGI